jgi:hypothetical protein
MALVRIDVSEELSASIIRVTRLGELGTTLAVTPPKRRFLQKSHGVTLQETASFIVIAVKTSNLTMCCADHKGKKRKREEEDQKNTKIKRGEADGGS